MEGERLGSAQVWATPSHQPPPPLLRRLAPSQVIPFKATVSKMVDHFESRANDLTESELRLAGRVLQVCSVLFWGFGEGVCI